MIGISSSYIHADIDSIDQGGVKNNSVWLYA